MACVHRRKHEPAPLLLILLFLLSSGCTTTVQAQTGVCDVNALGLAAGVVRLYLCADEDDNSLARIIYCGSWTSLDEWNDQGLQAGALPNEQVRFATSEPLSFTPAGAGTTFRGYTGTLGSNADTNPILTTGGGTSVDTLRTGNLGSAVTSGSGPALGGGVNPAVTEATLYVPTSTACESAQTSAANPCVVQGNYLVTVSIASMNLILPWEGIRLTWAPTTPMAPFDRTTDTNAFEVFAPSTGTSLNSCASLSLIGGANGDPHFLRWAQARRDSFHGECDMVLVSSQRGIDVQLRTKIRKFYSYIQKMAIRVGDRILEIDQTHLTFGNLTVAHENHDAPTSFPLVVRDTAYLNNKNVTISVVGEKHYKIEWGTMSWFSVSITGIFLNIYVGGGPEFENSIGMMGIYGTGEMLDREGRPMDPKDMNAYGMEWQVKHESGDPVLFSKPEGPQWPQSQCVMPNWIDPKKKRRMLRGNDELYSAAKLACSGSNDVEMCVEDIMVTGEMGVAGSFTIPSF